MRLDALLVFVLWSISVSYGPPAQIERANDLAGCKTLVGNNSNKGT